MFGAAFGDVVGSHMNLTEETKARILKCSIRNANLQMIR